MGGRGRRRGGLGGALGPLRERGGRLMRSSSLFHPAPRTWWTSSPSSAKEGIKRKSRQVSDNFSYSTFKRSHAAER